MLRIGEARITLGRGYARRLRAYDGESRISAGGNKSAFKRGEFAAPEGLSS